MPQTATATPLYEGLFLMSPSAGGDLAGAIQHVREMLERSEAELLTVQKWDERKLAYPIGGQKRGLFILALFRVRGSQIANLERDCNLSEQIVRAMMLRADHLGETEIDMLVKEGQKSADEAKLRAAEKAEAGKAEETESEQAQAEASQQKSKADEQPDEQAADESESDAEQQAEQPAAASSE